MAKDYKGFQKKVWVKLHNSVLLIFEKSTLQLTSKIRIPKLERILFKCSVFRIDLIA